MNKLEKYREYRANLNLIQANDRCGSRVNCLRFNSHSHILHEEAKFKVCWILLKEGYDFIVEAVFNDGSGRVDVFDVSRALAIEILHSEKESECDLKDYPVKIIKVKSSMKYEEIKKLIL